MFVKLFQFLALFGYLNMVGYEASCNTTQNSQALFDGDSLIEFVLNDVLNIPLEKDTPDAEVPFDEYRIFGSGAYVMPVMLFLVTFFFCQLFLLLKKIYHPFYTNKSLFLPGYYSFLFRFKPF